jgi:SAM-dependent methyltransferase
MHTESNGLGILDGAPLNVDAAVRERYTAASRRREEALCCPVHYDSRYLTAIPQEVLERDYGCGDPSRHVRPGETVLDLGSGSGKICFIAAQVVGPAGRVIGIDCNADMLELARRSRPEFARRVGFDNVEFRRGRIQDLRLDLDRLDEVLRREQPTSVNDWLRLQERIDELRRAAPLVSDASVDVAVSNCVLNLVREEDRRLLFAELFRVLKPGGRAVISDIVADRDVPQSMRDDPTLWSGCISGAFREDRLPGAFVEVGFHGVELLERQAEPWTVVEGIEFRSVTVRAFRPVETDAASGQHEVIYCGPWASVSDDAGRQLRRGVRTVVDVSAAADYAREPYDDQVIVLNSIGGPIDSGEGCGSGAHVRSRRECCDGSP